MNGEVLDVSADWRTDPNHIMRRVGLVSLTGALFGLAFAHAINDYRGEGPQHMHDWLVQRYGAPPAPGWVLPLIVATPVAAGLLILGAVIVFHRWIRPWLRVRTPPWMESAWSDNPRPRPLPGILRLTSWSFPAAAFVLFLTLDSNWWLATQMTLLIGPLLVEVWRTKSWREAPLHNDPSS